MDIILQDLDPREALLKWFSCNSHIRPNGRGIYDIPVLSFKSEIISSSEGSVMFNYGDTIVVASAKCEVAEPKANDSQDGYLIVNFHNGAGARSDVKPGPPLDDVQEITEILSKVIKSHVIDSKDLCLIPGILSRVIFLDAVCLCDTGYAFEASLLACLFALRSAFLPSIDFNEDSGMVVVQAEEKPQRLLLKSIPCSFLFAVLNRDIFMLSPDLHEKKACNGAFIRIILDLVTGSLLEIDKGQVCVPDNLLLSEILPIAKNSAAKLKYLLE